MKLVSSILVAVLCLWAPLPVWGQPARQPAPQPVQEPQSQTLVFQGMAGMWYPMESARRMLADIEAATGLRIQVARFEERVRLGDETATLLRDNLRITQEQSDHWRKALQAAVSTRRPSTSIWQSPTFWFFTGFVSAAVLAIGLTFGLSHADGG